MKKKNIIILILILLIAFIGSVYWLFNTYDKLSLGERNAPSEIVLSDAERFQAEYPGVSPDNVFVYKSASEIIDILKTGTGLVYLGFPECPWCQKYSIYLDEVAREQNLEKIYYYNVRQIRSDNAPEYQEMVALLQEFLDKDADGNPRIFVPDLTAVKDGEIVAHDNSTSLNSSADGTPAEWWTEERVLNIKEAFKSMIEPVNVCETTCNQ